MTKAELVAKIYTYFCEKYYQKPIDYSPTQGDVTVFNGFIDRVNKDGGSTGASFIFDYTLYQFLRIYSRETKVDRKYTFTSYIYGKAPYEIWKKRGAGWEHFGKVGFMRSRQIVKWNAITAIMRKAHEEEDLFKITQVESDARRRQNIFVCSEVVATSLWNPKDKSCETCTFKTPCMKLLQDKFPYVYKVRHKFDTENKLKNRESWVSPRRKKSMLT